jgi:hypothetical protein
MTDASDLSGFTYQPDMASRAVWMREQADERTDRLWQKTVADGERGARMRSLLASGRLPSAHPDLAGPQLPPDLPESWSCLSALSDLEFGSVAPVLDPETVERRRAERARFLHAEREYHRHAKSETGNGIDPEQWARQQMDRAEVLAQSHELARRLESVGKTAYRNEALSLWTYYIHSKRFETIPHFRRICLLPYVAAMVRASKLAALEYFLERNPFCRFWTFTSGLRVGIDGLRERCNWLHRKLSKLNHWLRENWGVEIVFRSTEFGTLEVDECGNRRGKGDDGAIEFGPDGEPLFHVHAHCVIRSLVGFIPPARWSAMIRAVHDQWTDPAGRPLHWDAGKAIRNPRECCKYVTKPGDMLKLTPKQLGRLHEAVFRVKLVQPMGSLAEEIRNRKRPEVGKTLRRYRTKDGCVWREVFDQNKHVAQDEADREDYNEAIKAQRITKLDTVLARTKPDACARMPEKNADYCRVLARMSPAVGPLGIKEPRVMVGGTRFDLARVQGHELVFKLWSQTVEAWEEGLHRIRVHTGTSTVRMPEPERPAVRSRPSIWDQRREFWELRKELLSV